MGRRKNRFKATKALATVSEVRTAVIYCRVSTREQAVEGASLDSQRKLCEAEIAKNGWTLSPDGVFVEAGESGKEIANRPALARLLAYCRRNRPTFVVIYAMDRLSRNADDHALIRHGLLKGGTKIYSVKEREIANETPQGHFIRGVLALNSQFENEIRTQKTVDVMRSLQEDGYWTHGAPLGYVYVDEPGKLNRRILVPVPELARHISRAFNLMATGQYTQREVLEILTREGFRRRSGRLCTTQALSNMFQNSTYAGLIETSWTTTPIKGRHKALVSEADFYRVQRVLADRDPITAKRSATNPDFPLRRFVRCGVTGQPFTGAHSRSRNKRLHAYYFPSQRPAGSRNLRKDEVEEAFATYLAQHGLKPELGEAFVATMRELWAERNGASASRQQQAEMTVSRLREERASLTRKLGQGSLSETAYREAVDAVERELADAEMVVRDSGVEGREVTEMLGDCMKLVEHLGETWKRLPYAEKQRLQFTVFPQGVEYENGEFRTGHLAPAFALIRAFNDTRSSRVPPVRGASNKQKRTPLRQTVRQHVRRLRRILGDEGLEAGLRDLSRAISIFGGKGEMSTPRSGP